MNDLSSPLVETPEPKQSDAAGALASVVSEEAWLRTGSRIWRYVVLRRMLALADLTAGLLATLLFLIVPDGETSRFAWGLVYLPAWILVAKALGLYDRDESPPRHQTVDEILNLVLWAVIGTAGLSLWLELTPAGHPDASGVLTVGLVAAVAVIPLRALTRWAWRALTPPERVAVVGPEASVDAFRRKLELFPDMHMTIVEERDLVDQEAGNTGWLSTVERLVIAPASLDDPRLFELIQGSRATDVLLTVVPPHQGLFGHAIQLNHLAELPLLNYGRSALSRSTLLLKRALDLVISTVMLVVLSPFLAVIAVGVKLDSRGPVFFSQWRAGRNGRPFRIHKFRTMVQNAEDLLPGLVRFADLREPVFKLEDDPRVTRFGRWLRRWSLDELPQLFNILRGEMSLVGPRPEQIELVDRYTSEQRLRLLVKPGLTGPMQVYGRGALGMDERMAVERDYIEHLSLGRDLRIVAMTVSAVFKGDGAF